MFNTKKNREVYENSPFGAAIFNADVSVGMVADIVGVSRQTVYGWFERGKQLSFAHGMRRAALTQALNQLVEEELIKQLMPKKEKIRLITSRYSLLHNKLLADSGEEAEGFEPRDLKDVVSSLLNSRPSKNMG